MTSTGDRHSPPASRRVLVTGGAGFIGSHLVRLLVDRGDAVTVVDDLSTGRRENLDSRASFVHADVRDALVGPLANETFDQIYHLAAVVGVKLVVDDPLNAIEVNVGRTSDVLRFALTAGPNATPAKVLLTSSSEVYGKGTASPFSEDDNVVYGPTTVSRWCYGCSKAIDEYLSLAYHRQHGLPAVVVRLFNTVGPGQVGDYGMVLPRFVKAALEARPIEVYGDGAQTRCFCDVRDVVQAFPALLDHPEAPGRVFNVGSDQPISIRDLAMTVVRTLASVSSVRLVPYADAYAPGFEDLRDRRPDLGRIRSAIGWQSRVPLDRTIRDIAASLGAAQTPQGVAGGSR